MTSRLRLGLLGVAHYHAGFWLQAWARHPHAGIVGIWDADAARADALAAQHGVVAYRDMAALLGASDAVGICSETADHPALIEAACAAGRGILCEKPVAAEEAGLRRVEAAIAASGVRFAQSFPKRTDPVNGELRRLLTEGAIGRPFLARIRHGHGHGADAAFTGGWWADPARAGGGTLLDEGVHATDLLRWLFGDPAEAAALLGAATPGLAVEDVALAAFRWPDGLLAEVATAWRFVAAEASVEIYGTDGTILVSRVDLASRDAEAAPLRLARRDAGARFVALPVPSAFPTGWFHQRSAEAFVDAMRDGAPFAAGLAEAAGAVRLVFAAYRAAREGRTVRLG